MLSVPSNKTQSSGRGWLVKSSFNTGSARIKNKSDEQHGQRTDGQEACRVFLRSVGYVLRV